MAAGVRAVGAGRPGGAVWDEFYAADACLYVMPSVDCQLSAELTPEQPPLGKWLIGWGMELLGLGPRGWRVAPVVVGTLTVLVLYILARRLKLPRPVAGLASVLLALDPLHLVLSRTAMLDVFVTFFVLLGFLCVVIDGTAEKASGRPARRFGLGRFVPRPWLLLGGIAAGAAVASKWSGLPAVAMMIVLTLALDARRRRRAVAADSARGPRTGSWIVGAYLVLVPALVYSFSYAGRLEGSLLALPSSDGAWVRALVERQHLMWQFHVGLEDGRNPYASPPWSWLLLKRPVAMYFGEDGQGRYVEVLAVGSPVVWWAALAALLHQGWRLVSRRGPVLAPAVAVLGFLAGYAPWLAASSARDQLFLYYLLPAVPFMCLALGLSIGQVFFRSWGKAMAAALVISCVATFAFFYPILVARPMTPDSWERRILFRDCQERGDNRADPGLYPRTSAGRPPSGWCWA